MSNKCSCIRKQNILIRSRHMAKTIAEQINDLQTENSHLKELEKFFDKAIKNEFHMDKKSIHKLLKNWENTNDYFKKICDYFDLKSNSDIKEFISIMCNEHNLNYFNSKRTNE